MSNYVIKVYSEIEKFRNSHPYYFQRQGNKYEVQVISDNEEIHRQTFYRSGKMTAQIDSHYEITGEYLQLSPTVTVPKNKFLYADVYLKEVKQNKFKTSNRTVL